MLSTKKHVFQKVLVLTISAVYLLILIGGIVRTTGSGMGCPDWPKCFGQYVPPINESELPRNYTEIFLEKRLAKNERLAGLLNKIGFSSTAIRVLNDPTIQQEEEFNVVKAWIEYINRLIGVLIGFLLILTAYFSFSYFSTDRRVPLFGVLSLVLVLFQGWFGSLVVSTNLLPGFVTVHMFLAFIQIAVLIYLYHLITGLNGSQENILYRYRWYFTGLFVLLIPQLYLGTQVRSDVDQLLFIGAERNTIIDNLSITFYVHRSASLVFTALLFYISYYLLVRNSLIGFTQKVLLVAIGCVLIEILGGIVMAYFNIPAWVQPFHLVVASILFGANFWIVLRAFYVSKNLQTR